jgi:tetratricopeptide (TPR) repeat protein
MHSAVMILCLASASMLLCAAKQKEPSAQKNVELRLDKMHELPNEADSSEPDGTALPSESEQIALTKECSNWFAPSIATYEKAHKAMYDRKYANAIPQYTTALSQNRSEMRRNDHLSKSQTLVKWACCKRVQARIYECRGYCFLQQKKYMQGIEDLTKAIAFHTTSNRRNYMNRGRAYKALGEDELAAADFEMVQMLK